MNKLVFINLKNLPFCMEKESKECHWCSKPLSRPLEKLFRHCFECGLKRLEGLTITSDPCPTCTKEVKNQQ